MTSWDYSYKESYYQLSNSTAGSGYDINATQVGGWTYIEKPVKDKLSRKLGRFSWIPRRII